MFYIIFTSVAPQIVLSSKEVRVLEEQNVTIACTGTGQPKPSITWSKPFGGLPKDRTEVKKGNLTIYKVEKKDRGTYICKAENILRSTTSLARLIVYTRLRFKVRPPQEVTPGKFGSTLRLPCVAESDLRTTLNPLDKGWQVFTSCRLACSIEWKNGSSKHQEI